MRQRPAGVPSRVRPRSRRRRLFSTRTRSRRCPDPPWVGSSRACWSRTRVTAWAPSRRRGTSARAGPDRSADHPSGTPSRRSRREHRDETSWMTTEHARQQPSERTEDMHHAPTASTTTGDHRDRVRRCVARVALVLLAAAALYQGLWAQLAPRSFYDDFPGGMSWLAGEGAYNEHFVRDIGGLANGLGVVAALTAWWLSRELVIANAAGWLTYALPHLAFHLAHPLDGAAMQVPNVVV